MISKIQATSTNQQQFRAKTVNATPQYLSKANADSVSFGKRFKGLHTDEFKNIYNRANNLLTVLEQKYSNTEKLEKNGVEIGTAITKFTPKVKMQLPDGNIVELSRRQNANRPILKVVDKDLAAPAINYDISPNGIACKQELAPLKIYSGVENEEESLTLLAYFQQVLNKFSL